jgi:hypothetical protein
VLAGQGTTDAEGEVTLGLGDGSYSVAIYHAGYTSGAETLTVPDDGDPTYSIDLAAPAGSVDPNFCNVYADVYDGAGVLEKDVEVSLRIVREPSGSGAVFSGEIVTDTSDANGRVAWPGIPIGCRIEYWRGAAAADPKRTKQATIAATDVVGGVYWLPKIVGSA